MAPLRSSLIGCLQSPCYHCMSLIFTYCFYSRLTTRDVVAAFLKLTHIFKDRLTNTVQNSFPLCIRTKKLFLMSNAFFQLVCYRLLNCNAPPLASIMKRPPRTSSREHQLRSSSRKYRQRPPRSSSPSNRRRPPRPSTRGHQATPATLLFFSRASGNAPLTILSAVKLKAFVAKRNL